MNLKHDKESIIKQGVQLFREKGYHNTGINDILERCQISKGTFYNYFKSKEEFVLHAIEHFGDQMDHYISSFLSDTSYSPLTRIRRLYNALIAHAVAENCTTGCLITNLSFELAGLNKAVGKALNDEFEGWINLVRDCIEEGQQNGEILTSVSSYELAALLHTAVNGAYGRVKMKRNTVPMQQTVGTLLGMIAA